MSVIDLHPFIAAHNASFDESVLRACCATHRVRLPKQPFVCTVKVARSVFGIYPTKLPDVCKHLRIPLSHHEAGSDAEACAQIVLAAMDRGWTPVWTVVNAEEDRRRYAKIHGWIHLSDSYVEHKERIPMGLKDAILQVMDRDVLKSVVNNFELFEVDLRSVASMRECVAQSQDATPEHLLAYLYERQVKDVCTLLGIDSTGRRGALVQMLLGLPHDASSQLENPATQGSNTSRLEARPATDGHGPGQSRTKTKARKGKDKDKEITRYGYSDLKEPRTPETGEDL